ncbi:PRD domain-containing protein [Vibrio mangrovi]|uniref:PRD domain-containing protein n=1 Tax=Vibrio mangrovi TaxID=474394 RepID=A0A1Y6J1K0_9VIBR|nr:PRD domain-containing protein [Vibrio mangrovi]MDW6005357.1 PRD domain-containing protein [Vibrio mangrovi]SMS02203.1 Transcription antiterminator LicT [Vibrio mangrovi]
MLTITKTLNSSVVLVEQNGQPMIVLGKGIGYGKKPGTRIRYDDVSQVFMPVDNLYIRQMLDSIDSIPARYFELTQEIVSHAEQKIGQSLNHTIYFALTDHLHFAVERFQNDITLTNRVLWEIKTFYRTEFEIGEFALALLEEHLGVLLPEQEAANVAFHLINAQSSDSNETDGAKYAHLVGKIINIVRYTIGNDIATDDIHYTRFITHVKFFVARFFSGKMLPDDEDSLFEHFQRKYPKAISCAQKIRTYIRETYQQEISDEEITYLAVHIYRLLQTET